MTGLAHFESTKQQLLHNLQEAIQFSTKLGLAEVEKDLLNLKLVLYREQFEVIVVGEFSNGKSTFINALLKHEVLPSSNVPTTALINKIYYHQEPEYKVVYDDGKKNDLTPDEFKEFVALDKHKRDGKAQQWLQKIKDSIRKPVQLDIGYPTSICENQVILIDSPGTNDMDEERVKITDQYIPKSDAAIFLLNATQIFSASERAFLQRILDADIQKIFFVINFKDLLKKEEDFIEVAQTVRDNLPPGVESPKLHFVSSLYALKHYQREAGIIEDAPPVSLRAQRRAAKQQMPLEETGILEFEQELMSFLSYERGYEKLRRPAEAAIKKIDTVINEHIRFGLNSLQHTIQDIDSYVQNIRQQLTKAETELKQSEERISRKVEAECADIVRSYSDSLQKIASIALNEMENGIRAGKDPEIIKNQIDLATGRKEKELKQDMQRRIQRMMSGIFESEGNTMSQLLSTDLIRFSPAQDWGGRIERRQEASVVQGVGGGTALVGLAALIFSGGTVGWGLLAGGAAAAAASTVIDRESDAALYNRLRSQVKARYLLPISKQTKELKEYIQSMGEQLKLEYSQQVRDKIVQERRKTTMLIENQSLKADEQQRKVKQLEEDEKYGLHLIGQLQSLIENYVRPTKGVETYDYSTNR